MPFTRKTTFNTLLLVVSMQCTKRTTQTGYIHLTCNSGICGKRTLLKTFIPTVSRLRTRNPKQEHQWPHSDGWHKKKYGVFACRFENSVYLTLQTLSEFNLIATVVLFSIYSTQEQGKSLTIFSKIQTHRQHLLYLVMLGLDSLERNEGFQILNKNVTTTRKMPYQQWLSFGRDEICKNIAEYISSK